MKLDLLTNATVVDDAIRFVFYKQKEKLKLSTNNTEDGKESNEPDYDRDGTVLEKQDEQIGEEITSERTTNQIF